MSTPNKADPRALLAVLEGKYVDYVLIGGLAEVIRGADRVTRGVDIVPHVGDENVERLGTALDELQARRADRRKLVPEQLLEREITILVTSLGELKVVPFPAGAENGYADLRRAARREHLGDGVRPLVASTGDLARMAAALHREQDIARLPELRRIMELEVDRAAARTGYNPALDTITRSGIHRQGPTIKP